jgi:hypothetical protein
MAHSSDFCPLRRSAPGTPVAKSGGRGRVLDDSGNRFNFDLFFTKYLLCKSCSSIGTQTTNSTSQDTASIQKEAEEAILIEPLEADVQLHESGSVVVCRAGTSSLRLFAEGRFTRKRRDESLTS